MSFYRIGNLKRIKIPDARLFFLIHSTEISTSYKHFDDSGKIFITVTLDSKSVTMKLDTKAAAISVMVLKD